MEGNGGRTGNDEGERGGRGVADGAAHGASQGHAGETDGAIGLGPGVAAQVSRPKRKCSNKTLDPNHFDSAAESSEDDEVMHRNPAATKARKKPSAKPMPPTTPLGEDSLWRPFREHLARATVGTYSPLAESATIDEKVERAHWPTN